jgi:hypothetical protein
VTVGATLRAMPLELGTGLTTAQMQAPEVFQNAGWDFDTIWTICEGDYPMPKWEQQVCATL